MKNWGWLGCLALLWAAFAPAGTASAAGRGDLAVIRPVLSCAALAQAPLAKAVGAAVEFHTATIHTPKGEFCQVSGTIAPTVGFEVDLPVAKWTQRFVFTGCGGLCGAVHARIDNATSCAPALDGAFALAASDLGHQGRMGSPSENAFAADPQKRIDFAYRANHVTTLAAKALIQAYYGQAPRYSYFSGCSDGGREALEEAERFPDDFDGISAGAPAMLFQLQNGFWHSWLVAANTRADGTPILLTGKLAVLHAAVLAHCPAEDGVLGDPRQCRPDPAWVRCAAGATETKSCLTGEEWAVAEKAYRGPVDEAGRPFLPGGAQPGSELQWAGFFVPREAGGMQPSRMMARSMAPVVLSDATAADADPAHYPFTSAQFARLARLHPLNDATNPDLRRFVGRGGRLILWHGWSDTSIAPMSTIAYAEAVRRELGARATGEHVRLYMLPGVGHCGGGDGFAQFDTLSPLMDWVEQSHAPGVLEAQRVADRPLGPPPGMGGPAAPYAAAPQPVLGQRAIAPFDLEANRGADAGWIGAEMLRPDFQKTYEVKEGGLVEKTP